jgi:hypothetical protein
VAAGRSHLPSEGAHGRGSEQAGQSDESVLLESSGSLRDKGPTGQRVEIGDRVPIGVDDVVDMTPLGVGERRWRGATKGETHQRTVNADLGHLSNGL